MTAEDIGARDAHCCVYYVDGTGTGVGTAHFRILGFKMYNLDFEYLLMMGFLTWCVFDCDRLRSSVDPAPCTLRVMQQV